MKKSLLLLAFLIASVCSWADYIPKHDFMVDDIYYRFNADGQTVSVTYRCNYVNYSYWDLKNSYSGDVVLHETVTYNDVVYPVTRIDDYAFYNCYSLTSIQFPNTIVEIGFRAFNSCRSLTQLVLPNSVKTIGDRAFSDCFSLTSFTFPSSLEDTSVGGFNGCEALTAITVPEGITTINEEAFSGCTSLASVSLPSTLTTISRRAFYNCKGLPEVTLPVSVKFVGDEAFSSCMALSTVNILCELREYDTEAGGFVNVGNKDNRIFNNCGELDVKVTNVNNALTLLMTGAFNNDYGYYGITYPRFFVNDELVTEINILNGFTLVPAASFAHIRDLKKVTFPATLKYIDKAAFYGCSSLEALVFPDALETIGYQAFRECTSLENISFGKHIRKVGTRAFTQCTKINKVEIGDLANWCSIVFDPDNDRQNNPAEALSSNPLSFAKKIYLNGSQLQSLRIPAGVETIGVMAFANCCRFLDLVIPNSVTTIGDEAFYGCADMETVTFGTALDSLGNRAFQQCTGLTTISLPNTVTKLGTSIFNGCSNLASVQLPSQISNLPSSTFYQCSKLSDITLPETMEAIGNWAFFGCSGLKRIDIPASVGIIGTEAFKDCSGLEGVYISDLKAWCGMKFGNWQYQASNWEPTDKKSNPLIYAKNLYLNGELVTDLVIPEGVETVEAFTFWGADCLNTIKITEGVKTIGDKAFFYCGGLTSIEIPSTLTSIGKEAFEYNTYIHRQPISLYIPNLEQWFRYGFGEGFYMAGRMYGPMDCFDLYVNGVLTKDLIVPKSITKLGKYDLQSMRLNTVTLHSDVESLYNSVFEYCSVVSIFSKSLFPPLILTGGNSETNAFNRLNAADIYVPVGRGQSYKNKWTAHEAIIKEFCVGDSNGDGIVSISDAVSTVNCILSNPSEDFRTGVADINEDGVVSISDAVGVVNIILNNEGNNAPALDKPEEMTDAE